MPHVGRALPDRRACALVPVGAPTSRRLQSTFGAALSAESVLVDRARRCTVSFAALAPLSLAVGRTCRCPLGNLACPSTGVGGLSGGYVPSDYVCSGTVTSARRLALFGPWSSALVGRARTALDLPGTSRRRPKSSFRWLRSGIWDCHRRSPLRLAFPLFHPGPSLAYGRSARRGSKHAYRFGKGSSLRMRSSGE